MNNVSELLELQISNVNNLLAVLKEETLAIASKKATDIQNIAQKKLAIIDAVRKQDDLLAQSFKSLSLKNHSSKNLSLKNFSLNNPEPSANNLEQISFIRRLLNQCHQHNDANGLALQRASLSMHKLRNLFEESIGKKEITYDEKGQASSANTLGTTIKT